MENRDKIIENIYETYDYDKFSFFNWNRDVSRVEKLVKSMSDSGLLMIPIVVNERFQIIDGQHRFIAAKELQLPIYYIIKEGYGLNEVISMNTSSSNWKQDDYVKCYAENGYYDYIILRELINEYYPAIPKNVIYAVAGDTVVAKNNNKIIHGKFEIQKTEQEIKDELNYLKEFDIPVKKGYSTLLYPVIKFCYEYDGVDNVKLYRQFDNYKDTIKGIVNIKDAAEEVERIYNHNCPMKKKVYIAGEYRRYADNKCCSIAGGGKLNWYNASESCELR